MKKNALSLVLTLLMLAVAVLSSAQNSMYFNGSARADVIRPYYTADQVKCLEVWVKRNDVSGKRCIWSYGQIRFDEQWHGGYDSWMQKRLEIGHNNGKPYIRVNGDETYESSTSFPANEWTHLAFNYDKDNAEIYINGKLVYERRNQNDPVGTDYYDEKAASIGAVAHSAHEPWDEREHYWNWENHFAGLMSDLRLWSKKRSKTEIFNNRYKTQAPNSDLLSEYLMDGFSTDGNERLIDNCYIAANRTEQIRNLLFFSNPGASFASTKEYRNFNWLTHINWPGNRVSLISFDQPYPRYTYDGITKGHYSLKAAGIRATTNAKNGFITHDMEGLWMVRNTHQAGTGNTYLPSGYTAHTLTSWDIIVETKDSRTGFVDLYLDIENLNVENELNGSYSYQFMYRNRENGDYKPVAVEGITRVHDDTIKVRVRGDRLQTGVYAFARTDLAPGRVLQFDGRDQHVQGGNMRLSGDFTIEFWAKSESRGKQPLFTHDSISSRSGIYLEMSAIEEKVTLQVKDRSFSYHNAFFGAGEWGHYAIKYHDLSNTFTLYVNGFEAGTLSLNNRYFANEPFYLGMRKKTSDNAFMEGRIDEFRVWNTARTEAELRDNLNRTIADGDPGLIRYHRFDLPAYPENVMADRSHELRPATVYRAQSVMDTPAIASAQVDFAKGGKSLELNGLNDYVMLSNQQAYNAAQAFSIEAWAKPTFTSASHHGRIFGQTITGKADRFALAIIDRKPTFWYENAQGAELAKIQGPEISINDWHHFTVNYDNRKITLFVDGIPVVDTTVSHRISEGSGPLYIGGNSGLTGEFFKGEVDEVRMWSTPRSIDTLILRKSAKLTGMEQNLVLLLNFDFAKNRLVPDASGLQNRGTANRTVQLIDASWGAATEVNMLYHGHQTREYKDGLRIATQGLFASGENDLIAFGRYDDKSEVGAVELGESGTKVLTRSWYITKYDDGEDYTNNIQLFFNPVEMRYDIGALLSQSPTVYYRNNPNSAWVDVGFNSLEVKDSNIVAIDISPSLLRSGYYTLGFKQEREGSALAFTSNSQPLVPEDSVQFIETLSKHFERPVIMEFWLYPPNKPSDDLNIININSLFTGQYYDYINQKWINKFIGGALQIKQLSGTNNVVVILEGHDNPLNVSMATTICTTAVAPNTWTHYRLELGRGNGGTDTAKVYLNNVLSTKEYQQIHHFNAVDGYKGRCEFLLGDTVRQDTMKIEELKISYKRRYKSYWNEQMNFQNTREAILAYPFSQSTPFINEGGWYRREDNPGLNLDLKTRNDDVELVKGDWPMLLGQKTIDQFSNNVSSGGLTMSFPIREPRRASISYRGGEQPLSANDIEAPIMSRFHRVWKTSFEKRDKDVTYTFSPKELGVDTLYPENTYFLLQRSGAKGPFKIQDSIDAIYIDKKGDLVVKFGQLDLPFQYDKYVTAGWTSNSYDQSLLGQFENRYIKNYDSLTMEAWVLLPSNVTPTLADMPILGRKLKIDKNNKLTIDSCNLVSTTTFKHSTWYHVAISGYKSATSSSVNYKLYINGKLEDAETSNTQIRSDILTGNGSSYVDEIRVWDVVRTQKEIDALKEIKLTGSEDGLIGQYLFNQPSSIYYVPNIAPIPNALFKSNQQFNHDFLAVPNRYTHLPLLGVDSLRQHNHVSVAGLRISNPTSFPFKKESQDQVFLSYIHANNAWENNAMGSNYAAPLSVKRRWKVQLRDQNQNGGLLQFNFLMDSMGINYNAHKDHTFYLLYAPTTDGEWQVQPAQAQYLDSARNIVQFTVEVNQITNGFYGIAYSHNGWGNTISFDGGNDYVALGRLPEMSWENNAPFTVDAWVKTSSQGTIFSKTFGNNSGTNFSINAQGYVVGQLGAASATIISSIPIKSNQFNHVAMVYDGDSLKLVVNGRYAGGRSVGDINNTARYPAYVGATTQNNLRSALFRGEIDELRIWQRALKPYELRNYSIGHVDEDSALVYRIHFNLHGETRVGNASTGRAIYRVRNVADRQWQSSTGHPYYYETAEIRKTQGAGTHSIKVGAMKLQASTSGANAFLQTDDDNLYAGHLNDSLIWDSTLVPDDVDARWRNTWLVRMNDDQLDGGEITVQFDAHSNWSGPVAEYDYFLLYKGLDAKNYRLVRYSQYQKDLNQKQVRYTVDATKLASGFYTLGYKDLGALFTASDTLSDANIKMQYQIPTHCLQNIGGRAVVLQVENGAQKVVLQKQLDSFSMATAYRDSFMYQTDAGQKDLFTMHIYRVGPGTPVCQSLFSDTGSTKPHPAPTLFVDSVYLHKHRIFWTHNTDQANAYRLLRINSQGDTVVRMLDSTSVSFVDSLGRSQPIVNGQSYQYCLQAQSTSLNKFFKSTCVSSKTIAVDLKASRNAYADSVEVQWNNIGDHTNKIVLLRDQAIYAILHPHDSLFYDADPVHGKKHLYSLNVYDGENLIMQVSDTGWVKANGHIYGRVTTLSGDYAVPNCVVKASARIEDSVYAHTTTTNAKGEYAFTDVYYGKGASFTITPSLAGHNFVQDEYETKLQASAPNQEVEKIQSINVYAEGNRYFGKFSATAKAQANHTLLEWNYDTKQSTLIQVFRDDSLLTIVQDTNQFIDSKVAPLQQYQYSVNAYVFSGDSVTEKAFQQQVTLDSLMPLDSGNYKAVPNNDLALVRLEWSYANPYVDGIAIYRNGHHLGDVPNTSAYRDFSGLNDTQYTYAIAAFKKVRGKRYESSRRQVKARYPSLAKPDGLKLVANQKAGDVRGNLQYNVKPGYNYKGLLVYRASNSDTALITTIAKGKSAFFNDTSGIFGTNYTYFVNAFKYRDSAVSKSISGQVQFPALPAPTIAAEARVLGYNTYLLKWTPNTEHYAGTKISYDGSTIYLPKGQNQFAVSFKWPKAQKSIQVTCQTYLGKNGQRIYSPTASKTLTAFALTSPQSLQAISAFKASDNNAGFVRLNWEYPSFIKPSFQIVRDGIVIDTVQTNLRSYKDFNAVPGRVHSYVISGYYHSGNGTVYTPAEVAQGQSTSSYIVRGQVRNTYSGNGVQNVLIKAKGGKGQDRYEKWTSTDITGYYQLAVPRLPNSTIALSAHKQNHLFTPGKVVTSDTITSYEHHFEDTTRRATSNSSEIAEIQDFLVTANESRQNVILRFNLSSQNYSGLEIQRGPRVLARIRKGEALNYVDTSGISGYSYLYAVRTYWDIQGNRRYSNRVVGTVDYPDVSPVEGLVARTSDSLGTVRLEWTHPNELLDYYRVYRNEVLLARVAAGQFSYSDTSGTPGNRYRYAVEAVNDANGRSVASVQKVVKAPYPHMPRVYKLAATALPDTNSMRITWTYPVERTRGYLIMRNNQIIDTLKHTHNSHSYSYTDPFGNPGTTNEYSVSAFTFIEGTFTKSTPISVRALYPALSRPKEFTATPRRGQDLVRIVWQYDTYNIKGFVVFRDGVEIARLPASQNSYDDATGLPQTSYNYSVVAYDIRGGRQYNSSPADATIEFPRVSAPRRLWASQYASMVHILLNWEHNGWLQSFDEERGYELQYAAWPVDQNLVTIEDSMPDFNSNWIDLSKTLGVNQRYHAHLNPVLQMNVDLNADIAANHYRIRSYRRVNGQKYFSNWVEVRNEGLTQESRFERYKPKDVTATQGTKSGLVSINWTDNILSTSEFNSYNIYRKGFDASSFELMGSVSANAEVYHDNTSVPGKIYIYEVRPNLKASAPDGQYERGVAVLGWSAAEASIAGSVRTQEGDAPVVGATLEARARIGKELFTYTATTNTEGEYRIDNVYAPVPKDYEVEVSYKDHEFEEKVKVAAIAKPVDNATVDPFIDLNNFRLSGRIIQAGSGCGIDSLTVRLKATYNDGSTTEQQAVTDEDGTYTIVFNPYESNLVKLEAQADTFRIFRMRPTQDTVYHEFKDNLLVISDPKSVNTLTEFSLLDEATIPVHVQLQTTCGPIPGKNHFAINVQSANGCYNEVFNTKADGSLDLHLPPQDYSLTVIGVEPLNQRNYPYLEYFTTVNKQLNLKNLNGGDSVSTVYTYHTIPNISYSGLNDYCGNNANNPAIVNTENRYTLQFKVQENQFGVCDVNEGYLLVYNDAIRGNAVDTLRLDENMRFDLYSFQPDNPNPSEPYTRSLRVEYHAPDNGFLQERLISLVVEGVSEIPGNDIMVNPSENGDVQLPLFILRDPPGDKSYSYIQSGSSFTQNITFKESTAWNVGGYLKVETAPWIKGVMSKFEANHESSDGGMNSYSITSTIDETYSTSSSSSVLNKELTNYLMHEDADVIIGAGMVSKYGISWHVEVENKSSCDIVRKSVIATGPGAIKTTWVYTVDQIRGLITEYEKNIIRVRNGTYVVSGEDTAITIAKYNDYIKNWEQVLEYHTYESKPHVCLCDKVNYYRLPQPWQNYLATEDNPYKDVYLNRVPQSEHANLVRVITEGFCNNIGTYANDGKFILNEDFHWTDEIIADYNALSGLMADWDNNHAQFLKASSQRDLDAGWSMQYNWQFSPEAKNITFSGGTSTQQSFGATKIRTASEFDASTTAIQATLAAIIRFRKPEVTQFHDLAVYGGYAWSQSSATSKNQNETSKIGYILSDDDPGDQYSVSIIKGIYPNHSPYFDLLGGRSSCPSEPGTISRDQLDVQLLNTQDQPVSPVARFIDPESAAVFPIKITNNSLFNENREVRVSLASGANAHNARIWVKGVEISGDVMSILLGPDESMYMEVLVERSRNRYAHEDITLVIQPKCADRFNRKTLSLKAFWQHPCTDVEIISDNRFAIYRNPGGKEQYLTVLGGYDVENELLQRVNLQYRRLGDERWTTWQVVPRDTLVDYYNRIRTSPPRPARYPIYWDITGDQAIVDGTYEIRAQYICENVGTLNSNVVQGTVDRTSFQMIGTPAPADGVLSLGEQPSARYNKRIAGHSIKAHHLKVWQLEGSDEKAVPFTYHVDAHELHFHIADSVRKALDGKTIYFQVDTLYDENGILHREVESWKCNLSYNPVYWKPASVLLSTYSGSIGQYSAMLQYVDADLAQFYQLSGMSQAWLSSTLTSGNISLSGEEITFTVDARSLQPGWYRDTIWAQIGSFGKIALPIALKVHRKKPNWQVRVADYEQSVHVMANYTFGSSAQISLDTMDIIAAYVGSELRGVSNILKTGSRYAAYVPVYGNPSDKGRKVHFRVWRAADGKIYDAWLSNNDTIRYNPSVALHGSVVNPRILQVQPERDLVRFVPLQKGWNWLSLNVAQQRVEQALLSLSAHDGDVLKNINTSSEYTDKFGKGGVWVSANGLNNVAPENGYLLHIAQADTLYISGDTASTANITVQNGWNLIGYPRQKARRLDFGVNFNPQPGNNSIIKSQDAVAVYASGAWGGSLNQMKPFEAYMVKVGQTGSISFKTTPRPEEWEVDPATFEFNMTITARLKFGGEPSLDTNDLVGAFIDGELRGVGRLQWLPQIRKYRVVLFVYSHQVADETIQFKIYDSDREMLYTAFETVDFVANQRLGQLSDPYILSDVQETGVHTSSWLENDMVVYPNPVTDVMTLEFESALAEGVTLEMTDVLGRKVYSANVGAQRGLNQVQINTQALQLRRGMYHITLRSSKGSNTIKVHKY